MKLKMNIEAKTLQNIKGQNQHYLIIGDAPYELILNVGEKTIKTFTELSKQPELPLIEKPEIPNTKK